MRTNFEMKECPFCGEEIKKEAIKCRYCKSWLSDTHKTQTKPIAIKHNNPCPKRQEKGFIKISAIWLLVILFITSGLFIPYWLYRTIKTINKKLKGKYEISKLNVTISLVLTLILIVITFISNYYFELGDQYMADLLFNYVGDGDSLATLGSAYPENILDKCIFWLRLKSILQFITLLFNWVLLFRIKKGLELISGKKLSGILTFLFNYPYLQYKINKIQGNPVQTKESVRKKGLTSVLMGLELAVLLPLFSLLLLSLYDGSSDFIARIIAALVIAGLLEIVRGLLILLFPKHLYLQNDINRLRDEGDGSTESKLKINISVLIIEFVVSSITGLIIEFNFNFFFLLGRFAGFWLISYLLSSGIKTLFKMSNLTKIKLFELGIFIFIAIISTIGAFYV